MAILSFLDPFIRDRPTTSNFRERPERMLEAMCQQYTNDETSSMESEVIGVRVSVNYSAGHDLNLNKIVSI